MNPSRSRALPPHLAAVLAVFALVAQARAAETDARTAIQLDTPVGGWRTGGSDGVSFTQRVSYPANDVSTPDDQPNAARIRGMIANAPKGPATLVVNGVSMPMRVEDDGRFDRPYLFPSGSNSIEVRAGGSSRRVQFQARESSGRAAKLRIVLGWDSDYTDLDLHVVTPDGEHAWYGNRVLGNGGAQDVDVTSGYGPEIFASPTPLPGTYLVYVNYFGGGWSYDEDGNASEQQAITTASITLITEEGSVNEKRETFFVPMREAGELTLVKRLVYP